MTLSIETFKPKKAELVELAHQYKDITINGIDDTDGYHIADKARKHLKATRVEIQKVGKGLRADALKFQKDVIAYEKELIDIIEPIESSIKAAQDRINEEKIKIARVKIMPIRMNMLANIDITRETYDDIEEIVILMDNDAFDAFYNTKHSEYLQKKEQMLAEKERQINREKEIAKAKEDATREAEERLKHEAEKKEREEAEARHERERKEQEENERIRKNSEYLAWLKKHGVDDACSSDIFIEQEGNTFTLYKKVDSITIQ